MDMEKLTQENPSQGGLLAKALSLGHDGQSVAPFPRAIIEKDGIFSIHESLETGGVELDPGLKALVDSVLESGQARK